jgi:hypothetical protein
MNKEALNDELDHLLQLLTVERGYDNESQGRIMQTMRLKVLRSIVESLNQIEGQIMDALVIVHLLPKMQDLRTIANDELAKITGAIRAENWDEM